MRRYVSNERLFACAKCRALHHPHASPINGCCKCGHSYLVQLWDDPLWPTTDKCCAFCRTCGAAFMVLPPNLPTCRYCNHPTVTLTKEQ